MQSMTRDIGRDLTRQAVFSQLSGLTIAAINSLVTTLLINVVPLERRVQHSTALGSTTAKITMFYLVNSVAIPIIAVYLTTNSDESWYASSSRAYPRRVVPLRVDVLFVLGLFCRILPMRVCQ